MIDPDDTVVLDYGNYYCTECGHDYGAFQPCHFDILVHLTGICTGMGEVESHEL